MKINSLPLRILGWIVSGASYYWFAKFYDYLLYTFVVLKFGLVRGGTIMLVSSFFLDYLSIKFYSRMDRDLFGIKTIKELKAYQSISGLNRFSGIWWMNLFHSVISKILRSGDPVVFLVVSAFSNPFLVTAYFKEDNRDLTKRDWQIFISSFIVSNIIWILVLYGIGGFVAERFL